MMRTVWKQRRGNLRRQPPHFVPLDFTTAFCHLGLSDMPAHTTLYQVAAAIRDMFTRLKMPAQASPYFVLDGVDVTELRDHCASKGHSCPLRSSDRHACLKVLVMGWSRAPFLEHSMLLALLGMAHRQPPSSA